MSIRRGHVAIVAVLSVQAAALAFALTPALAHTPKEVGSFSVPLVRNGGVEVEQSTQDVFVMDAGEGVVKKYTAGGATLLSEFNGSETPAKEFNVYLASGVAVDQSSSSSKGDVYIAEGVTASLEEGGVVDKFKPKAGHPNEYEYVCQLTGPGAGCLKIGVASTTPFLVSRGVAVDSEGNVYVASRFGPEFGPGVIYEFDSEGNYLGTLAGANVTEPSGVAAGPEHTLYMTNNGGNIVKVTLNASHEKTSESVLDPHVTGGVTVDPTTGNVYVTDWEGGAHIVVYDKTGKLVEEFATKGELNRPFSIAYSAHDGRTYVANEGSEQVVVYAEGPEVQARPASSVSDSGAMLSGTVNPNDPSAEWFFEYGETTGYGSSSSKGTVTSSGEVSAVIEALKPGTEYHYRLDATNSRGTVHGSDMTFVTAGSVTDSAAFASNISQFAATLNATVDPGILITSYHFVYGLSSAYGSVIPLPDLFIASGQGDIHVSQPLVGLQGGRTYHFAVVISDATGTFTGPDTTFQTSPIPLPLVNTTAAGEISEGAATLSGTVDPQHWDTTYHFEYGTSTAYGSTWPTVPSDMGALTGNQPVTITLGGLQPGTTYHYRLVASNGGGTTYGTDQSFTTNSYPLSVIQTAPVGNPLGITPTKTSKPKPKAKPKAKTHKHPTKHKNKHKKKK